MPQHLEWFVMVIDNWNRCWREDLYYLALATVMHDSKTRWVSTTVFIFLTHGAVHCLGCSPFGCEGAGQAQGCGLVWDTLFCLCSGVRMKVEHLPGARWVMGIQESKCNSAKTFYSSAYLIGQVGHMVKLKVKGVITLPSKWEEEERRYLLNCTPTYWEIQASDDGGGDSEWCQTGPVLRYFCNLVLIHLEPRENTCECSGGRCLNTGINNYFIYYFINNVSINNINIIYLSTYMTYWY